MYIYIYMHIILALFRESVRGQLTWTAGMFVSDKIDEG